PQLRFGDDLIADWLRRKEESVTFPCLFNFLKGDDEHGDHIHILLLFYVYSLCLS
ncbi:uncharacterized, partial [Tachysurus ichikawai]